MFLFEKSVIGTYCNNLYDLKESHSPFSCYKANSAGKNLNTTNNNMKKGMLLNHFVVALVNVCMGVRPQTNLGGHQIFARKICHCNSISKKKKKKKGHRPFRCTLSITFGLNMPSNVGPKWY